MSPSLFTLRENIPFAYWIFTCQEKGTEIAILTSLLFFLKVEENNHSGDMVPAKSLGEVEVTLRKEFLGALFIFTSSLFL